MKVLNVSVHDWANFAYDNAQSLRAVGVNAVSLSMFDHSFGYEKTSRIAPLPKILEACRAADVIQVFHSPTNIAGHLRKIGKPVIVYHTGTGYRQAPEMCHGVFDPFVAKTVFALPELYNVGIRRWQGQPYPANKPVYVVGGIEIPETIDFSTQPYPRIAHYPSKPLVKGTQAIREVFADLCNSDCHISEKLVPYSVQLARIARCDVYVEMMATEQTGKPYGSFGITALEAAAMGKIVVTNCVNHDVYSDHYGVVWPFIFANDKETMLAELQEIEKSSPDQLELMKREMHSRFVDKHSHAATGKYLQQHVLNGIL